MTELGNAKLATSSTATQYMLITLSMHQNIIVEATEIVDVIYRENRRGFSRVNNYNR